MAHNNNIYITLFTWFLILSVISLLINIANFSLKKKEYSLPKWKSILVALHIFTAILFIINTTFFIVNESAFIMISFVQYVVPIISFNISTGFFIISLIVFLIPFLESNEDIITLEGPSYINSKVGSINIGSIIRGKSKKQKFFLSLKDLEKHMFICGATGTGKTNFLQNFLINLSTRHNIPFFLVEFKGEYHHLQEHIEDIVILRPGEDFSINIFDPEGSNPEIHAERIFDILKSGKFLDSNVEFSPQMEKVLVEILIEICQNEKYRCWSSFEEACVNYLRKNKMKIPMLSQTLISVKNRIRRFSMGPLRAMFEGKQRFDISELFKRKILLDLSSIIRLGGEKEDALFFLNMILKYLWDMNLTRGSLNFNGITHLTIIEDAQYFAPKNLSNQTKLSSYLEDIALLQRGTGECLVTLATRPDISEEILANCGVLVTFKNHMEKEFLSKMLNLDIENENYLSILEDGNCIIRTASLKKPFLLSVPLIKRKSLLISDIRKKNSAILKKVKKASIVGEKSRMKDLGNIEERRSGKEDSSIDKKQNEVHTSSLNEEIQKNSENVKVKIDYQDLKSFIHDLYNSQEKNH